MGRIPLRPLIVQNSRDAVECIPTILVAALPRCVACWFYGALRRQKRTWPAGRALQFLRIRAQDNRGDFIPDRLNQRTSFLEIVETANFTRDLEQKMGLCSADAQLRPDRLGSVAEVGNAVSIGIIRVSNDEIPIYEIERLSCRFAIIEEQIGQVVGLDSLQSARLISQDFSELCVHEPE